MSRKRHTEMSWDSDDDLLNEDTYGVTTVRVSKDFDEDVDEDALLGSDDELENIRSTRSTSKDRLKSGKSIGTVISTSNKKSGNKSFSPIKWEPKKETKPEEFELEDEIELLAPDEVTEFDSYDTGNISQNDVVQEQAYVEPSVDDTIYEEHDEGETSHEQSHIEAEVTRDESDESEDEGDKRGGRFKSERQNIVTITSKPTTHIDIPDTLEISDEQQQQINEFMASKDKRRRPNQRGYQYQQNRQQQPSRIQTITSTSSPQPFQLPTTSQPEPILTAPPQHYPTGSSRPKIYMNPHFRRTEPPPGSGKSRPHSVFDPPPRSQPSMFRHEQPIPRHHFDHHPQPLMDPYRPVYNQPPPPPAPHHLQHPHHGQPPSSQHFSGPMMNTPPRFQHQMEPRPLFGGPPPPQHLHQGGYGGRPQMPPHEQYRGPPHSQPNRPPRPLFPFEGPPHSRDNSGNRFDHRPPHEGPGPGNFNRQQRHGEGPMEIHQPRPNHYKQDQHFQPQPRMPHPARNNFQQPRQPQMRGGHRPPLNARFQGPRPSLQQQHSKKILQRAKEDRAKKFGNIQNIPVIGRQTMKRPSTDTEEASPPKMIKPETAERIGLSTEESKEYIRKMEQQEALREEIRRRKEMKREADALKRRRDLQEKLARQGKNIAELEGNDQVNVNAQGGSGNIGRGQTQSQRGQQANMGRCQRGHPANMGRGQQGFPANRGGGQLANTGRGQPPNRGRGQLNNRGNRGQGQPGFRGQTPQRGRGQTHDFETGRQQMMQGKNNGPFNVAHPERGRGRGNAGNFSQENRTRKVIEPHSREAIGDINQQRTVNPQAKLPVGAQTNRQVTAPKFKRMKKIIRTKKNAKGEILSTEIEMIPLGDDEVITNVPKTSSSSSVISPFSSPEPQPHRVVVDSSKLMAKEENTRTVVASSPVGNGKRNIVIDNSSDTRSKKVRIDNLSSSTSDSSIKHMCSCVGPIQSYQRLGKSATIVFFDPRKAIHFAQKYNRHMIDLSHISVKVIPE